MAAASVASQLGITGSPLSAAVAYYLTEITKLPGFEGVTLLNVVSVTITATFCGVIAMSLYSLRRGKELEDDPEYQRRMQDSALRKQIEETSATSLDEQLPASAKNSVYLFLTAIATIVVIAMLPSIKPTVAATGKVAGMDQIIQIVMLTFGGLILILTKTDPKKVPNGIVFKSGMVAAIAIFGIAWMSDTYFTYAMPSFKASVMEMVQAQPWTFAFAMFAVSVVVNSQAVTAKMLLPVGIAMGLPAPLLVGLMPATYAYFFIPNYPSDIATVNFDVTGTTKIGKYYFNHSFMAPGLVGVITACVVGITIANILI